MLSLRKFIPSSTFCIVALVVCGVGCPRGEDSETNPPTTATPTLRILVVEDDELAEGIRREWTAAGRGEVELQVASADSLREMKRLPADAIIYPSGMLGELAERELIVPLPNETLVSEAFNRADFFPSIRLHETTWGRQVYAVPLGSPSPVLLYRRDVLEKLNRQPPRTWAEFDELAALINESDAIADLPGVGSEDWQSVIEPLAASAGAEILIARAASYAQQPGALSVLFDYETMEPLIDGPPFVRALEEIVNTPGRDASSALDVSYANARQQLLAGRAAMTITWPTMQDAAAEDSDELEIACARLPGADSVYNARSGSWEQLSQPSHVPVLGIAGRMGSITSSARHTQAAASALTFLAGAEVGPAVAKESEACSLVRSTQVAQGGSWTSSAYGDAGGQYAMVLQEDKSQNAWCFSPRIPGRDRYLAALDEAVKQAVVGEKTPQLALTDAADQWRQITADIGVDSQRKAYARSLGIED